MPDPKTIQSILSVVKITKQLIYHENLALSVCNLAFIGLPKIYSTVAMIKKFYATVLKCKIPNQ